MSYGEGIGDLIIAMIISNRNPVQFRKIIREREFSHFKEQSVRTAFSRFHNKGYLGNKNSTWYLTEKGRNYAKKAFLLSYITSPFKKNEPANTVISFDIPETERQKRNWLRNQIKIFGYKMLQQSFWLGPGPLPAEFLKRLKELDIRKNVKILSVKEK